MAEQRVIEAEKMGFSLCILPKINMDNMNSTSIKLVGISNIRELKSIL